METKHAFRLTAAIMVVCSVVVLAMTLRIRMLEAEKEELHRQLHEAHQRDPGRCMPVQVTCECPEYDEGWEDAQYAEGCDTSFNEISIEDLQVMCSELETFGYVPGC